MGWEVSKGHYWSLGIIIGYQTQLPAATVTGVEGKIVLFSFSLLPETRLSVKFRLCWAVESNTYGHETGVIQKLQWPLIRMKTWCTAP